MERVLKRVGLAKKSPPVNNSDGKDEGAPIRRRRRSKSRRRNNGSGGTQQQQQPKKTLGIFNIDWESVKDCKSCKSRAITRTFCSRRSDNELYRSNSFKFERFVRGAEEVNTLGKKISLCDDYSLPVDNVGNKKRPNSIAVPNFTTEWNIINSPNEEKQIEILETYSTPRDSKQQLITTDENETKCFTSPDREYSQPYTTEGSSEPVSDDEFFDHISITPATKAHELNSPDSITEAILPQLNSGQSPNRLDIKRHPSPYYYADLYKNQTFDESTRKTCQDENESKRHHTHNPITKNKKISFRKYRKSLSLDNPNLDKAGKANKQHVGNRVKYKKSSSVDTQSTDSKDAPHDINVRLNTSPCVDTEDGLDDEMQRQRRHYETAFDCRISKSDDDLDEIDKVTNHPVLVPFTNTNSRDCKPGPSAISTDSNTPHNKRKVVTLLSPKAATIPDNNSLDISRRFQEMHLTGDEEVSTSSTLPPRHYTPSPPSTAPLPNKFATPKPFLMNSIRSAPNLPKTRLKDLRLPVKSTRGRRVTTSNQCIAFEPDENKRLIEIKDWPRQEIVVLKHGRKDKQNMLEYRGKATRRRHHKYSSTESMTTSSSGGSMESIKSSTSEGNRSTTSTDSRQSSSLSSHSSDSGNSKPFAPVQTVGFVSHTNKLHILSPISDKSSQEPISETSDNRNNNSQKCSPEEVLVSVVSETIKKRRVPQNKNLLNLGFHTDIQGSDSGISIQSREGIKPRFGFSVELPNNQSSTDFADLPFDMPKLRRRRIADACTSGSATSIDLRDLPFDMPKLRRRLRVQQSSTESSVSQASSSQSVIDADRQVSAFRPKLALNLGELEVRQRPELPLSLVGLRMNLNNPDKSHAVDSIDVNLPLEKQGWFHGAITRVEAENVLRMLKEGSFLVRNSESIKQDYSLSLKSARGFMHMRIQKDGNDENYILGQFSKPFHSIPEMIRHFCINRLPIRGAEHMCLLQPVVAQLL